MSVMLVSCLTDNSVSWGGVGSLVDCMIDCVMTCAVLCCAVWYGAVWCGVVSCILYGTKALMRTMSYVTLVRPWVLGPGLCLKGFDCCFRDHKALLCFIHSFNRFNSPCFERTEQVC